MSKEKQCKCCKEYWWDANIHTQSGLCPNCYDYVADLEAKLAEKENAITNLIEDSKASKEWSKQQLAEMQNEKDELISKYRYWRGECAELKQQLAEKDQDKISFAVGQLILFKHSIEDKMKNKFVFSTEDVRESFDNQIKQLKEGK